MSEGPPPDSIPLDRLPASLGVVLENDDAIIRGVITVVRVIAVYDPMLRALLAKTLTEQRQVAIDAGKHAVAGMMTALLNQVVDPSATPPTADNVLPFRPK